MRRIVLALLVAALLGAFGLAVGRSAADALERAVERHTAGVEQAVSLQDAAFPTDPGAPVPFRTTAPNL